jgi:hypothetical protein
MINRKSPSLVRLIDTDYIALGAVLVPLVMWCMYAVLLLTGSGQAPGGIFFIAAAITVIAALVLLWRYRTIAGVFADGIEVPATIHNAAFFRDRGRLEYVYTIQGEKYLGGVAVHKNRRTAALRPGEQVVVLVDPDHPKRAFIRDLYV